MGTPEPKQFLPIAGMPILMRAAGAFQQAIPDTSLIIVLHHDLMDEWFSLCGVYGFHLSHKVVAGGKERFHSVNNGLKAIAGMQGLVAVHDAARPLATPSLIRRSFELAGMHGAAVPVIPVNDTVRELRNGSSFPVNRDNLYFVQTPQSFQVALLKKAYERSFQQKFTDDAAVVEAYGHPVKYFPGEAANIKITRPEDISIAEAYLQAFRLNKPASPATGT